MHTDTITSWGRVERHPHQLHGLRNRHVHLPKVTGPMLAFGNGRSYGDSNLNPGGHLLMGRHMDRFVRFDPSSGELQCEAGVLLQEIIDLVLPQGWFLPVTPGTQFVTVGGAIANDVHGKNHHVAGSFGCHVLGFELLRSDGSRRWCTPNQDPGLFAATIGGLGLTGLITWASLRLRRVFNPWMDVETIRFRNLGEFFELSESSAADHEYTVSWIDCAFTGKRLGRGLFSRANHAPAALGACSPNSAGTHSRAVPVTPPISLINPVSLKAFNTLYFHKQRHDKHRARQHLRPFFYPLDALLEWNRIYGPKGFYQYQCVIPAASAQAVTEQLVHTIASSGMGSFLAVLKQFGSRPSPGLLSFPCEGTTLALDFPNQGPRLHTLFAAMDRLVLQAGGRLYPAKDGRMSGPMFRASHPKLDQFLPYIDPRFSSAFWRRVTETS